jgi:ubiquinone/menaquinone biosynthesis C-methylase UbiE/uncharacterized protein YbaR (Trm112 family)
MNANPTDAGEFGIYTCPACKRHLGLETDMLRCPTCAQAYPVRNGIPEFLDEELSASADPELRRMATIDRMARIYESKLWYPIVLDLFGGFRSSSLERLIASMVRNVEPAQGRILDVACGPGTYGRRVASPSNEVFGIDVSRGMLRQGRAYAVQEGVSNIHFARARVEALPFEDGVFAAALCCGSLHLFTDTVTALREIARVLQPAATLSVFTFTVGSGGLLKYRRVREWYRNKHGLHVFELPEMGQYLRASGFEDFRPQVSGSILTFTARRQAV